MEERDRAGLGLRRTGEPVCTHRVELRRIGAGRWCAIDPQYPANDARCLVGYIERTDHVFHAIRLDSSPVESYDEPDLESVLQHFQAPPVSLH